MRLATPLPTSDESAYWSLMINRNAAANLLEQLSRWSAASPLHDKKQLRQICPQPRRGTYAYLHCLYAGLGEAEIDKMAVSLGRPIPPKLFDFYIATNGARLFEGQVSVGGLVIDFSRNPAKAVPICIEQHNLIFSAMHPDWHNQGYFRIGGVSFLRQDQMICGPNDQIAILHEQTGRPLRRYVDIFDCLESFAREMAQFWTAEGDFIGDWETIDHLLLGTGGMVQ